MCFKKPSVIEGENPNFGDPWYHNDSPPEAKGTIRPPNVSVVVPADPTPTPGINPRRFELWDITKATDNFSRARFLGEGPSGVVFHGFIKLNKSDDRDMPVAIKRMSYQGVIDSQAYATELLTLTRLSHPNLVTLYGYCSEKNNAGILEHLLVYEFLPRGSLQSHLHRDDGLPCQLTWQQRVRIAFGAAKGLAYLHNHDKNIVHRDFQPSNILITEDFEAKLTDFGLAIDRFCLDTLEPIILGSFGYLCPHYTVTGELSYHTDVFAFGVVLWELLTGKNSTVAEDSSSRPIYLTAWAKATLFREGRFVMVPEIVDSSLNPPFPRKVAKMLAVIAGKCSSDDIRDRPTMKSVVESFGLFDF